MQDVWALQYICAIRSVKHSKNGMPTYSSDSDSESEAATLSPTTLSPTTPSPVSTDSSLVEFDPTKSPIPRAPVSPDHVADAARKAEEALVAAEANLNAAKDRLEYAKKNMAEADQRRQEAEEASDKLYETDNRQAKEATAVMKGVLQKIIEGGKVGKISARDAIQTFEAYSIVVQPPTNFQAQWDAWYRSILKPDNVVLVDEVFNKAILFLNIYEFNLDKLKKDYDKFQNKIKSKEIVSTIKELWQRIITAMPSKPYLNNDIIEIAVSSAVAIDAGLHKTWEEASPHFENMIVLLRSYVDKSKTIAEAAKEAEGAQKIADRALERASTNYSAAMKKHEEARRHLKRPREPSPAKTVFIKKEPTLASFVDNCM